MTTTTKKLSRMPYAQAKVIIQMEDTGAQVVTLQSYATYVAQIDEFGWLEIGGLYSATTRKHIGAFMREYCDADYQLAKQCYERGWKYNIHTGEILEAA